MDELTKMERAILFAGLASLAVHEEYDKLWTPTERDLAYELAVKSERIGTEDQKALQAADNNMTTDKIDRIHAGILLKLMAKTMEGL